MSKDSPNGNGFEPPKHIASLISAINDGGKAAQSGMLLFMLVALYLLAMVFSTSDEDLLRNKTITIAQIGASLPPQFSFAIAPLVFVFLHTYTLMRFDMLAKNLRHLVRELSATVPRKVDREHCRQFLANTEFILALAAPRGSPLHSRIWGLTVSVTLAIFPPLVLFIVQIDALRYQNTGIIWALRLWILFDLAAVCIFFFRNQISASPTPSVLAKVLTRSAVLSLALGACAVNIIYCGIVPEGSEPSDVRASVESRFTRATTLTAAISGVIRQPLDNFFCPHLGFGCRFLRVERRTLVARVWDEKAIAALSSENPDFSKMLPAVEGIDLRDRSLRFAVLDESRLFAADLVGAKLDKSSLSRTKLPGARLSADSSLTRANLSGAQLSGADLRGARLDGADMRGVELTGANMAVAVLAGADLTDAQLSGANLEGSNIAGATPHRSPHFAAAIADVNRPA